MGNLGIALNCSPLIQNYRSAQNKIFHHKKPKAAIYKFKMMDNLGNYLLSLLSNRHFSISFQYITSSHLDLAHSNTDTIHKIRRIVIFICLMYILKFIQLEYRFFHHLKHLYNMGSRYMFHQDSRFGFLDIYQKHNWYHH